MVRLTVRYFAGARAAAGVADEDVELPGAPTVAQVLDAVRARHGDGLARVLAACSFLVDGVAVRDHGVAVPSGAQVDVLPPFAGG
ncbi:MoaD/ThiS family protein [Saccharothrix australiensis]|uniref:Molybdopterin synthase sulfur carrier subunit n=1 Tax=Saccharothrix australiensis TaxID=2072 RepID=A0A495VSI2_9PSEU|nr:MoaD/ThiS family protein [Saccharothrix australiensis]RKT52309.1 molybdopterin converting factor small subunit [Saccharothrix australiensis]